MHKKLAILLAFSALGLSIFLSSPQRRYHTFPQALIALQRAGAFSPGAKETIIPIESEKLVLGAQELEDVADCQNYLESWLAQQPGEWGVVVKDLVHQEKFSFNSHQTFHAASVMKLVTAVTVFDWMEENRAELDFWVKGQTLRQRLTLLINQSNNYQWADLNTLVTLKKEQELLKANGLDDADIYTNTMSAEDVFLLLNKIYQGLLLNSKRRDFLLQTMQNTINENRIPAGIPDDIPVAHKYGSWQDNIHDAGFVLTENPYLMVVMTHNVPAAEAKIARLSHLVYQMFEQNKCWLK